MPLECLIYVSPGKQGGRNAPLRGFLPGLRPGSFHRDCHHAIPLGHARAQQQHFEDVSPFSRTPSPTICVKRPVRKWKLAERSPQTHNRLALWPIRFLGFSKSWKSLPLLFPRPPLFRPAISRSSTSDSESPASEP